MIRSRRAKRVATLVAPGCAAAFLAGVAQGPAHYLVLPDSYPWLLAYWSTALALIAIVVALALRMAVDRQELASTSAGLGSLLFATLLTAFAVGLAWPCLVGLDNEGQEPTCADLVTFYLAGAVASGTIFGAFVGTLSWAARELRPRHG